MIMMLKLAKTEILRKAMFGENKHLPLVIKSVSNYYQLKFCIEGFETNVL